jgi:hypothetical protein
MSLGLVGYASDCATYNYWPPMGRCRKNYSVDMSGLPSDAALLAYDYLNEQLNKSRLGVF